MNKKSFALKRGKYESNALSLARTFEVIGCICESVKLIKAILFKSLNTLKDNKSRQ